MKPRRESIKDFALAFSRLKSPGLANYFLSHVSEIKIIDGQAGVSRTMPYLADVLAMGRQINPDLTSAELLGMLFTSVYVAEGDVKIINPKAFIEKVELSLNE